MLRLTTAPSKAEPVWKGKSNSERAEKTDILHSIMPTPVIKDGYIYGVCSYGQLRCIKVETGERVWETMKATRQQKNGEVTPNDPKPKDGDRWGNAFLTPQGDNYWLFNEHGDLILAKLSPGGYEEIGRMNILAPDNHMANRPVVWSHPAYADRKIFARNDSEIVCVDLSDAR
jgi:outer membrane protein assembly factor BamB